MKSGIWKRLTATSLSNRYYQVTNGAINAMFGRHLGITHLVEYPRCGGTWIRHLLQDALGIRQYAYDRRLSKDTIIQCHKLPSWMIRRAIVVFRDPRDAMVSFYHKQVHYDQKFRGQRPLAIGTYRHDPQRDLQDDFVLFLKAQLAAPEHPRFSFREFATRWLAQDNACYAKYEDFKTDPVEQLGRLAEFLGWTPPHEELEKAVEKNSFANRTRRRSGTLRTPGQSDNHQFERKGIVGDWQNLFNQQARQVFAEFEGETLLTLGYESDHQWVDAFPEDIANGS
ncbi:MAG: sulfotransferase domain-containing protein [Mariniblastus sp.]|nr:sulfotransferase domain-containing protein [Mariniblastus sp.]